MDLREACYGTSRIGVRRLRALIAGLPIGSALHRSLDPTGWAWGTTEELLAVLVEVVDLGNRQYVAFEAGRNKVPKPIDIRRPWKVEEPKRFASHAEIEAFFGKKG